MRSPIAARSDDPGAAASPTISRKESFSYHSVPPKRKGRLHSSVKKKSAETRKKAKVVEVNSNPVFVSSGASPQLGSTKHPSSNLTDIHLKQRVNHKTNAFPSWRSFRFE